MLFRSYLLFDDAPRSGRIAITDQELYQKFLLIEKMPADDRDVIKSLLQAMIVKNKLQDLLPDIQETAKQKDLAPLRKVAGRR